MPCGSKEALVFGLGLLTGTGSTIIGKVLYGVESTGLSGEVKSFKNPIFQAWLNCLAMAFALPIHWGYRWHIKHQWASNNTSNSLSDNASMSPYRIPWRVCLMLGFPAALDLLDTILANLGLMHVTVSVYQLLNGLVIVFVALLKVFVLKDQLRSYMWVGIALNLLAALLVGLASLAEAEEGELGASVQSLSIGILLLLLSCAVNAVQYVFEEKIMAEMDSATPLVVVGVEGLWGLTLTSCLVYPVAFFLPGDDLGSNERLDDSLEMLINSKLSQVLVAVFLLTSLGTNVFGVSVTYLLDSIWYAILDNFRPVTVWGVDLLLFYVFTRGAFGEQWTDWSWLQLVAMGTLLVGTAVYNGTWKLPGFSYLEPLKDAVVVPVRRPEPFSTLSKQ